MFETALDYLEQTTPRGSPKHKQTYAFGHGIERTAYLLDLLGEAECRHRSIIVAGTKGKGSTAAMLSSILTAAGYRAGMFTGPHLQSYCERFQIDGRMISENRLAAYIQEAKQAIESKWSKTSIGTPTKFEILTAIALRYFDDEKVDFVVLEVGIGGRHDSVNVANPLVSVITSISLEHTAMLGDTLSEIAYAKAGIIRPNGIVVSAPQKPAAENVIENVCADLQARLIKVGVDWEFTPLNNELYGKRSGQYFRVSPKTGPASIDWRSDIASHELFIPLLGAHQVENAMVALATVGELSRASLSISQVKEGFKRVKWPGRLEILRAEPLLVVDGAHNPYSMQKLAEALPSIFQYDRLILVLGIASDKNIPEMLEAICSLADELIVTQFNHPRSTAAETIAELAPPGAPSPRIMRNAKDAVSSALNLAQQNDLICVSGSLYLVGEVRELLLESSLDAKPPDAKPSG